MDITLDGEVSIVTGAGRGMGRGIARVLAHHGARVLVADVDEKTATDVAGEIAADGREAAAVRVDVSDRAAVRRAVDGCLTRWGTVDILVNNAGTVTRQMVEDTTEADLAARDRREPYWSVPLLPGGPTNDATQRVREDREHLVERREAHQL